MAQIIQNTVQTLYRINPARNMQRFYCVSLQPTLFGDIALVRQWGRIGTRGQSKSDFYTQQAPALLACEKLVKLKTRRGYIAMNARGC